jgi:hypothetical protein
MRLHPSSVGDQLGGRHRQAMYRRERVALRPGPGQGIAARDRRLALRAARIASSIAAHATAVVRRRRGRAGRRHDQNRRASRESSYTTSRDMTLHHAEAPGAALVCSGSSLEPCGVRRGHGGAWRQRNPASFVLAGLTAVSVPAAQRRLGVVSRLPAVAVAVTTLATAAARPQSLGPDASRA